MKEKVLVIGAAKSGIAAAKLLMKHGYDVSITDMSEISEKQELAKLSIHVFDQGHPQQLRHDGWAFVVKNPGINYRVPFVKYFVDHQVQILTEVEIAYRYTKNFHYGAITGTNGKTTITTLLYEMLQKNKHAIVAGNIGYPLSEFALQYEHDEKDVALELSNFQLLGIDTFAPEVSVVCNLAPDHLDYMDSEEAYYQSKMRIYENCTKDDWFLRNVDDEKIMKYATNIPCTIIDFSLERQDVDLFCKEGMVYLHDTQLFAISDLKIVGRYNISNAMIAACMAYKLGVTIPHIQEVIRSFTSVEHRMEFVSEIKGVRFYNDSKATNTHAVMAALQSFDKNIILLAGGHDKGIPFDDLKIYDDRVKVCIAFGETKHLFKPIFHHTSEKDNLEEALKEAIRISKPGDIILLSPACSSYDQFKNYEERGNLFKQLVAAYKKKDCFL